MIYDRRHILPHIAFHSFIPSLSDVYKRQVHNANSLFIHNHLLRIRLMLREVFHINVTEIAQTGMKPWESNKVWNEASICRPPLMVLIFDIGGGIRGGKKFKAVQIGGPSGGATTASQEHLDLPLDFDSLKSIGAMIGSGGLVVMDEDTCMVETARFFMEFTQKESCGK